MQQIVLATQSPDIDFTVYAEQRIPYIDKHSRRGRRGQLIVDAPTSLVVAENVRRRIEAIAGLRWLRIYDSVGTCGRIAAYGMPLLKANRYLVIKYGGEATHGWLTSCRLLILHRETAEVQFEGSAGDEG